jgi:hypothetical protein
MNFWARPGCVETVQLTRSEASASINEI